MVISRTISSSVSTSAVRHPVQTLGGHAVACSAGCSGRSARPAGRWPPARKHPSVRVINASPSPAGAESARRRRGIGSRVVTPASRGPRRSTIRSRVGVDVHRLAADEAGQGQPGLGGQLGGQRAGRRNRRHHRDARPAPPSGSARTTPGPRPPGSAGQRQPALAGWPSRSTLSTALCRPTSSRTQSISPSQAEQTGGVQPAGLVEGPLLRAQQVRRGERPARPGPGARGPAGAGTGLDHLVDAWWCRRPRRHWWSSRCAAGRGRRRPTSAASAHVEHVVGVQPVRAGARRSSGRATRSAAAAITPSLCSSPWTRSMSSPGRAHGDHERLAVEPDLQRLLDGERVAAPAAAARPERAAPGAAASLVPCHHPAVTGRPRHGARRRQRRSEHGPALAERGLDRARSRRRRRWTTTPCGSCSTWPGTPPTRWNGWRLR